MPRRAAVVIASVFLLLGCYNYLPLTNPSPQPGTYLSAALTDSGSVELARYLGPGVAIVRGRLLASDSKELALAVVSVRVRSGEEISWKGESVTLPRGLVAFLEERRLSTGRSVLLAGGSVLSLVVAAKAFGFGGFGAPSGGGKPTPR